MVKPLIHDPIFLAQKSVPAARDDLTVAQDQVNCCSGKLQYKLLLCG